MEQIEVAGRSHHCKLILNQARSPVVPASYADRFGTGIPFAPSEIERSKFEIARVQCRHGVDETACVP